MADFGQYPANMAPQDALIVRENTEADHAVVPYTGEDLARPKMGPANPFRDETTNTAHSSALGLKRKNVLTGMAEETFVSEHTFRSKHRAIERRGGPGREHQTGTEIKNEAAELRRTREGKGNALIADGDGAYVGPWAKYKRDEYEEVGEEEEIGSDEEVEYVYEDEDERADVVASGTVVSAPAGAIEHRREVEALGDETTTFHGDEMYDYQGRTYMHVPQDLDIDLRKEPGEVTNFIPKKLVHTWKNHGGKAVTALRFFPKAGHLLLSSGADCTVKIWDVYHNRQLLRTFSGHSKAVSDISFNLDGTKFVSSSFDRQMKLWDTETGVCVSKFTTGKTPHCLQFYPGPEHSHEFLAGMSDKKIVQFDTRTREQVQEYDQHLNAINTITFVDQNRRFMTTSDDKSLRAWDYGIPVPIKYIAEPYMYPMTRAAPHPSGKYVAFQSSDNQIVVYGATDKFRQNRKKSFRGHNNAGTAIDISVSPDGQFLASGDTAGFVCFWDWKTCKMYHKLPAGEGSISCVQWHPQETSKVAAAGADGVIRYWD